MTEWDKVWDQIQVGSTGLGVNKRVNTTSLVVWNQNGGVGPTGLATIDHQSWVVSWGRLRQGTCLALQVSSRGDLVPKKKS